MGLDVVVLAGGRSSRFGADKVELLLDRVLAGLPANSSVTCVGPERATARADVAWVREEPPFAGPLAAVAAGLAAGSAAVVVLVGADMPAVGLAVPALVAALEGEGAAVDGTVLVDADGRPQVLASAWHRPRLTAVVAAIADDSFDLVRTTVSAGLVGRPLRLLLEGSTLVRVADAWGASRDVDTRADLTD
jgi:molybdopterin-guanine dinucleotide biosynthesis protein A